MAQGSSASRQKNKKKVRDLEQKVTKSKRADNKKGKNRSRKHGKTQNRSEVKLKKKE